MVPGGGWVQRLISICPAIWVWLPSLVLCCVDCLSVLLLIAETSARCGGGGESSFAGSVDWFLVVVWCSGPSHKWYTASTLCGTLPQHHVGHFLIWTGNYTVKSYKVIEFSAWTWFACSVENDPCSISENLVQCFVALIKVFTGR